ncbi:hypothetical protein GW17_00013692 [Ensete ventricosum]|nr:hypothetical protein GW17_00013692 [Ensete ventricosum]
MVHTGPPGCQYVNRSVRMVHTSPSGYRYADHPLPGDIAKNRPPSVDFDHQRSISTVSDQFRLSAAN